MSVSLNPAMSLPVDLQKWPVITSLGEYFRDQVETFTLVHHFYYFCNIDSSIWCATAHEPSGTAPANVKLVEIIELAGKGVWKIMGDAMELTFGLDADGRLWRWMMKQESDPVPLRFLDADGGYEGDNQLVMPPRFLALPNGDPLPPVVNFYVDEGLMLLTRDRDLYISSSLEPNRIVRLEIENVHIAAFWSRAFILAVNEDEPSTIHVWEETSLVGTGTPISLRPFTMASVVEIITHLIHDFILTSEGEVFVFAHHRNLVPLEHEREGHTIRRMFSNYFKVFLQFDDGRIFQIVTVIGQLRKLREVPEVYMSSDLWAAVASTHCSIKPMLSLKANDEEAAGLRDPQLAAAYRLYKHMQVSFNDSATSDLRIVFRGYPPIFVHRAVLTSASPYWQTRLEKTWGCNNLICPSEYCFEVYYLYFKYLYTKHIGWMSYLDAVDLLGMAHAYLQPDLVEFCSQFLVANYLECSNCLSLYQLAELYNVNSLRLPAAFSVRDNWTEVEVASNIHDLANDERMQLMIHILNCTST